ncbi:hypothetical protein N784_11670 [Pontibacillus litoralis JSM 072002]|uniref:Uncharacterized protein n=1 Tax=Pontibacillus litoralis JSM 072002 TaxID=1385512 RepID=A0A0A5G1H4_9BACI|nr:hypothetical protein N784_11670 [Pontibacillus litoralis JSM 072002]
MKQATAPAILPAPRTAYAPIHAAHIGIFLFTLGKLYTWKLIDKTIWISAQCDERLYAVPVARIFPLLKFFYVEIIKNISNPLFPDFFSIDMFCLIIVLFKGFGKWQTVHTYLLRWDCYYHLYLVLTGSLVTMGRNHLTVLHLKFLK